VGLSREKGKVFGGTRDLALVYPALKNIYYGRKRQGRKTFLWVRWQGKKREGICSKKTANEGERMTKRNSHTTLKTARLADKKNACYQPTNYSSPATKDRLNLAAKEGK